MSTKFTKEMVDDYADKLLIGLTSEENQMVLDEFEIIDETINTIKSTIPALNNSHLTPYDCKDLLPDGEYTGIEEDYIAFAILVHGDGSAELATLKDDNIYIQLSVNYNGQTYSSELMNSVAHEVKISVPVDCELDNITAKFQSIYGELSFWDALISQKTPPEGYKRIQGNLKVLSNTEIDSDE